MGRSGGGGGGFSSGGHGGGSHHGASFSGGGSFRSGGGSRGGVLAVAVLAAVQDHTDQGQGLDLTMIMVRGHIITEDPVCPLPHHQEEDIMVAEQPMYMQMAVPEAVPAMHLLQLFCSCSS